MSPEIPGPEEDAEFEDHPPPPSPSRNLEQFVRENPIVALFGAFLAGVVIGRIGIL